MRPMPSHREDSIVEPDVISTTEATPDQSDRLDERSLNEVLLHMTFYKNGLAII